jgi:hypothetical protein
MKIRIICTYQGGQSLSVIAHEHGLMVSTVNTIMQDAAHIKEYVIRSFT